MQVGDLVKIQTRHEGKVLGVVIEEKFSRFLGREWLVHRQDNNKSILCSPCDLWRVDAGR